MIGSHLYAWHTREMKSLFFLSSICRFSLAMRDSTVSGLPRHLPSSDATPSPEGEFPNIPLQSEGVPTIGGGVVAINALRSYRPRLSISNALQSFHSVFNLLCTPIIRLRVVCIPNFPISAPIHLRPSFSATASVVPDPQKKSATRSQGLEDAFITLSSNNSGF